MDAKIMISGFFHQENLHPIVYAPYFVTRLVQNYSLMAYNNRNTLLKMVRVQDIVLEQKRHGVSQVYVYENLVRDIYLISYSTFNRWLSYPAKQELKSGRKRQEADKRQLSLGL